MTDSTVRPKSHRRWREGPDNLGGSRDEKHEYGKDCDRVLYSSAFRRLSAVTQVVSADEAAMFHNRLTHSLKVAQVAVLLTHRLQERITADDRWSEVHAHGGLDSRVVRAACLAHDLGHPPFGHVAEEALQQVLQSDPDHTEKGHEVHPPIKRSYQFHLPDSFEGNAQSFRIATKLAFRERYDDEDEVSPALNLTAGTLMAICKYPWTYSDRESHMPKTPNKMKWGYYDSERKIFEWAQRCVPEPYPPEFSQFQTIEAQVMDWADDISYAVHDAEDFYRAGLIPLDLLRASDDELNRVINFALPMIHEATDGEVDSEDSIKGLIEDIRREVLPANRFVGSRADRERLHKFASKLITDAVKLTSIDGNGLVSPTVEQRAIVELFKQLTWYYVIRRPELGSIQRGATVLIRELFRDLAAWAKQEWSGQDPGARLGPQALPIRLMEYLRVSFSSNPITGCSSSYSEDKKISRAVVDYIVSLTERQAVELGARLSGHTSKSVLEQLH